MGLSSFNRARELAKKRASQKAAEAKEKPKRRRKPKEG